MVAPPKNRPQLGRVELRYTLHTGSLSQAKARARKIAAYVLDLFHQLGPSLTSYTPTQPQHSIRDFVATQLVSWADHSTDESVPSGITLPGPFDRAPLPQVSPPLLVKTLLAKVINKYATEKKNAGKWTPKIV
jgi:hypothetical protein